MRRFLSSILLFGLLAAPAFAAVPQAGHPVPDFRLQDQRGHWQAPAGHLGHWLAMYFYPGDFTAGCTAEGCAFRDDLARLRQAGADVAGVSLDDAESRADFAARHRVPFPLLADSDHAVARARGVLASKDGIEYARRSTLLVDARGRGAKVYADVDPEKNAAQVRAGLGKPKAGA